eukprot:COSAG02_NODE_575_length_20117_cov_5.801139_18_plen_40_part_00
MRESIRTFFCVLIEGISVLSSVYLCVPQAVVYLSAWRRL